MWVLFLFFTKCKSFIIWKLLFPLHWGIWRPIGGKVCWDTPHLTELTYCVFVSTNWQNLSYMFMWFLCSTRQSMQCDLWDFHLTGSKTRPVSHLPGREEVGHNANIGDTWCRGTLAAPAWPSLGSLASLHRWPPPPHDFLPHLELYHTPASRWCPSWLCLVDSRVCSRSVMTWLWFKLELQTKHRFS